MVVLNVTYKCKPGMREAFLGAIRAEGLDRMCLEEDGNFKYDYYFAADDADELLLVEKWRDADALSVHSGQPHFKRIGEIKSVFVEDTVLEKYYE